MRWVAAVFYCILVVSLGNIRSCVHDGSVIHAGVSNHAQEVP